MELVSLNKLFHIEYGNGLELVNLSKSKNGINFVARTQKNNEIPNTAKATTFKIVFFINYSPFFYLFIICK